MSRRCVISSYQTTFLSPSRTWSAARANPDSALFDGSERTVNDRRSERINVCSMNKSPLLNVKLMLATFGQISVLGTMSVLELPE